jgi:plasmid stabilization system protein ParE
VTYEVLLADDAENDLLKIYRYAAFNASPEKADQLWIGSKSWYRSWLAFRRAHKSPPRN